MVIVAMKDVGVCRSDDERNPAQRKNRDTECQILTAPVSDQRDLFVNSQPGAAEHADTAKLRRTREAVELRTEAAVANPEIGREAAEGIALALPQTPDLGHNAVIRPWCVQRAPASEVLAADCRGPVAGESAVNLDSERAVLAESLVDGRE